MGVVVFGVCIVAMGVVVVAPCDAAFDPLRLASTSTLLWCVVGGLVVVVVVVVVDVDDLVVVSPLPL